MTDINDLKFTIEPEETIEIEQFVNSDNKEKEKKIWIQVNWGFYRRREFTIHDLNVFDDCKTLEDIQKKIDEWHKKNASLNDIASAATANGRLPIIFDTSIKNTQIIEDDVNGAFYSCPEGKIPSFVPINYDRKRIEIVEQKQESPPSTCLLYTSPNPRD